MKVPANKIEEIETQTGWAVWMAVIIVPATVVLIDWLIH